MRIKQHVLILVRFFHEHLARKTLFTIRQRWEKMKHIGNLLQANENLNKIKFLLFMLKAFNK